MTKMRLMNNLLKLFAAFLLTLTTPSAHATNTIDLSDIMGEQEALLKVDEAFQLSVDIVDDKALVKF